MSTLSVCLIAKNEEAVIERVLTCASKFADEIIVVDTGSTDNTKNIAKKFTDKVYDFTWINDFAAARNYSFDQATMDYCMWLDCDDVISDDSIDLINFHKFFLDKVGDGFTAPYKCSDTVTNVVTRIVKRGSCKWVGFIHEYLNFTGPKTKLDFEVVHSKPESSSVRDAGRNLRIFEQKMQEGVKFSARDYLYFSKELYWNNRPDEALDMIKRYYEEPGRWSEDDIQISIIENNIWAAKNNHAKAVEVLATAISKYGLNAPLLYNAGLASYRQNKYAEAIYYFMPIINKLSWNSTYFVDNYNYLFHALVWTSCSYWYLGKKEVGKTYHNKAKLLDPNSDVIKNNESFFGTIESHIEI